MSSQLYQSSSRALRAAPLASFMLSPTLLNRRFSFGGRIVPLTFASNFRTYSSRSSKPLHNSNDFSGGSSSSTSPQETATNAAHFLDELTAQDKRDVLAVEEAYGNWWTNIKFRKGWATPPFQRGEVEHLLRQAAEFVVRIRKHLDSVCPGQKLRVRDGSAEDFFWSVNYSPTSQPNRFVRELVHATFKDAKGYVESLDAETVDQYMTLIQRYCSRDLVTPVSEIGPTLISNGNVRFIESQDLFKQAQEKLAILATTNIPPAVASSTAMDDQWRKIQTTLLELNKHLSGLRSSYIRAADEEQKRQNQERAEREAAVRRHTEEQKRRQQEQEEARRKQQQEEERRRKEEQQRAQQQQQKPPAEDPTLLKIKEVGSEVIRKKTDIQRLVDMCDTLALDQLGADKEKSAAILGTLQDQCVDSSTKLMKDLLSLEGVLASTPEAREKKRAQTAAINDLLRTVEQLGYKLHALRQVVESAKPAPSQPEEASPKAAPERPTQRSATQQQQPAPSASTGSNEPSELIKPGSGEVSRPEPSVDVQAVERARQLRQKAKALSNTVLQEEKWKALKFEPKFESEETSAMYLVKSYIPNIDRRDISVTISEDHQFLQISGHRIPTKQELQRLASALVEAVESGREDSIRFLELSEEQLLLAIAAGRYGSFQQAIRLPDHVDVAHIEARYDSDRGLLSVVIPKTPFFTRPTASSSRMGHPHHPVHHHRHPATGSVRPGQSPTTRPPTSGGGSMFPQQQYAHRRPTNLDDLFW